MKSRRIVKVELVLWTTASVLSNPVQNITIFWKHLVLYLVVNCIDCYALEVRGSNPFGGEVFRIRPDRYWGPPSLLYNGYRVFPGGKAAGAWRLPPAPSNTKVKERVELYLYFPFGPSWPVLG